MQALYFLSTPDRLPEAGNAERAGLGFDHWRERLDRLDDRDLADRAAKVQDDPAGRRLLEAVFGNSPFLTECILSDIAFFTELLKRGPRWAVDTACTRAAEELAAERDPQAVMSGLRRSRREVALAVALADISGAWTLEEVTAALSDFAEHAIDATVSHLLLRPAERGEIALSDDARPTRGCGIAVLALGKLGSRELNYSSDVDLIVIYDPERIAYRGRRDVPEFCVRLTRELVRLLEERTREGYVLRCDLRLRPDPSATPLALSFSAAETYYESLGQNWERAAMIKARATAGDVELGREFLDLLRPFVWRKHLDFWAIQDIHSIKRQIYAHKGGARIAVNGHNIKTGRGGIREVEFFAQTQQLIWGGRDPDLRCARTEQALTALAAAGHVERAAAERLCAAYRFLRGVEHRLQMIEDRQTQTLPEDDDGLAELAAFLGYRTRESFEEALLHHMHAVEDDYAELFEEAPPLSGPGNLVFTGGEPEPGTLETLRQLGFADGERVFNMVRAWHHGRYRATRSKRSREILTELVPALLQALGRTAQPDSALAKFDQFLAGLPAGVQLFSMLYNNPKLLDLLATIMGGAPALAEHLSRNPGLLDAVLTPGFFDRTPPYEELARDLAETLADARDFQDVLDLSRRWTNDRKFQVGVGMLQQDADIDETGRALSDVAKAAIRGIWPAVLEDFEARHGRLPRPGLCTLALGKLGGREMTISSDLDLIFVYEVEGEPEASDGDKPLEPGRYFARLAQRLINAITALTGEGRLYDIDMRLRPSGKAGPIAVTLAGFRRYHETDAWTWEHMALTRARPILGEDAFAARVDTAVREVLCAPRDPERLLAAVADMRARIAREHPAKGPWDVKYLRGGLVDLEFIAQTLQLRHAHAHPGVLARGTQDAFRHLAESGVLDGARAERLIAATRLMRQVQGMLRLTAGGDLEEETAPEGLKTGLARAAGAEDFATLRARLHDTAAAVYQVFVELIEEPGEAAATRLADGAAAASDAGST